MTALTAAADFGHRAIRPSAADIQVGVATDPAPGGVPAAGVDVAGVLTAGAADNWARACSSNSRNR
jgi:hypothetical protein